MARGQLQHAFTAVIIIAVLGGASTASAKTVHVSTSGSDANDGSSWAAAKRSVPAGLSAADPGDQVWVAAGTYVGMVTLKSGVELYGGFVGSETQLEDRDWTANVTILDGNQLSTVVVVQAGAASDTRIDGFTIRNGIGARGRPGGGIYCGSSSPVISNNVVSGNVNGNVYCDHASPTISDNTIADGSFNVGAGIFCYYSSPTISNNTITGNKSSKGAGIYCDYSAPLIRNNTIAGNEATNVGGGIYSHLDSSPAILHNKISGNHAQEGGGLYFLQSTPVVYGNTIAWNHSTFEGAAIYCRDAESAVLSNTIVGNASGEYHYPPVVYSDGSDMLIANNVIAFNSAGLGGGGALTLHHNCVYNPEGPDYDGVTPGASDLNVDPQLLAAGYAEVHLKAGSPCIDAGDNSTIQPAWLDMDGQPRIQGAHVDIGADEFNGTTPSFTSKVVRVGWWGNDNSDGATWSSVKRTIQAAIDAVAQAGVGEVWVAKGTYGGGITLKRGVHVYGGFTGIEAERDQRDWIAYPTILDGLANGSVVSAYSDPYAPRITYGSSTIDGFTIRNTGEYGGGISCICSSPIISNNNITGNKAYGIYGYDCSPAIFGNVITANARSGINCSGYSPKILDNTITGNQAPDSGGGIWCNAVSPEIRNNTITGNTAKSLGGGIYCYAGKGTISGNTVTENTALSGGGVSVSGSVVLSGNTITGNSATKYGGGLHGVGEESLTSHNTITGNRAAYGGGIYLESTTAIVSNNTISGNTAANGAGIECLSKSADILKNTISDNVAASSGGGIHASSQGTISGNLVLRNTATSAGGIYASSSLISGNTVAANVATKAGGGVFCLKGEIGAVVSNKIIANRAPQAGGIYCEGFSGSIANNTIVENVSESAGGGIYYQYSSPSISNNIVAFNSSGLGQFYTQSMPMLRNNCVYNPDGVDYSGVDPGLGDISLDPSFVDRPAGDYHLAAGSPCIDAGYNAGVPSGFDVDFEGNPRFMNDWLTADCQWAPGNCGTAPIADMGAYEFVPPIPGDFDDDNDVDGTDREVFEACVTGPAIPYAPDSLPEGCTLELDEQNWMIADFNVDGVVDMDDFAVFQRCWSDTEPGDPNCSGL